MSMTRFAHLSSRLFNAPLMIRQEKAEMLVAALANRLGIVSLEFDDTPRALAKADLEQLAFMGESEPERVRKLYEMVEGIAIIPVEGTLVHKLGSVHPWSGMTGYDGLAQILRTARADDDVKAIMFDGDTPGGEVSGCFDFADELYEGTAANGGKPTWWMANEMSFSAGYALASQCDKVIIPRTGGVGSVGVVMLHMDMSEALKKGGVAVTLIHSGEHKVDGNRYERLPKSVLEELTAECDATRELFAETVARGRGMTKDAVLATEARCYSGKNAVAAGFADTVASESDAFMALLAAT